MTSTYGFLIYLGLGTLGGFVGSKLKLPAGTLTVAMLTIIVFKLVTRLHWEMPKGFGFMIQVLVGVMVGASFQPAFLPILKKMFLPLLTSTITLVGIGILLSIIFIRMGILDATTAYLGTSPGAMSALIVLGLQNQANATLLVCFHFFRVVFIILTAPLILKFFSR